MKTVKIAIIGMGTVGGGAFEILERNRAKIAASGNVDVVVKKVLDKDPEKLKGRVAPSQIAANLDEILSDPEISIVAELMGGVEPAKTFILKVMQSGKSVVTANKELVSKHWAELEAAAKAHRVGLYFEASCVGGVPIIRTLKDSFRGDNITEITGIINGTTNYILTEMTEKGMGYADALKAAQSLGYAEADPTADVEGYDAMYKLSILSSLAFHVCLPYTVVSREGITAITALDVENARRMGYVIKLLAVGKRNGDRVEVRVHPTFVKSSHPLAAVSGAFNAVFLKGDYVDDIMLYGRGAGARPTGSAVVSDIVCCAKASEFEYADFPLSHEVGEGVNIAEDFATKYYIALTVRDEAGVLAQITDVFGAAAVSIASISQSGTQSGVVPIVIMTHTASERSVRESLKRLKTLSCVEKVDSAIKVID